MLIIFNNAITRQEYLLRVSDVPRMRACQRLGCQLSSSFQETNNLGVFVSDFTDIGDKNLFLLTASTSLNIWGQLSRLCFLLEADHHQ